MDTTPPLRGKLYSNLTKQSQEFVIIHEIATQPMAARNDDFSIHVGIL
ncbi:hypothetical protein [Rickettsia sp. TH2014]|nr:hypothetical protein [Rickettsia sp. TH2014]